MVQGQVLAFAVGTLASDLAAQGLTVPSWEGVGLHLGEGHSEEIAQGRQLEGPVWLEKGCGGGHLLRMSSDQRERSRARAANVGRVLPVTDPTGAEAGGRVVTSSGYTRERVGGQVGCRSLESEGDTGAGAQARELMGWLCLSRDPNAWSRSLPGRSPRKTPRRGCAIRELAGTPPCRRQLTDALQ